MAESSKDVWSESQFIYNLLKDILLLPITLLLVIAKKKEWTDLLQPLKDLWRFLTDARMTFFLILLNIILFFTVRAILYFNGFGFVDNVFTGTGFANMWSIPDFSNMQPNLELIGFQIDNILAFQENTLFMHPIYIIPFLLAGFTHLNFIHLFGNMVSIFIFGRVIEKKIGPSKVFAVYLVPSVLGFFMLAIFNVFISGGGDIASGASIAVFGFIAAAIILSPFYITYESIIPLPIIVVALAGLVYQFANLYSNILQGISSGISYMGHVLGFFISFSFILFLYRQNISEIKLGMVFSLIAIILSLVAVFGFGIMNFSPEVVLANLVLGGYNG
ncbi:rhomboid family intramembrane serine protease [Candidatus Woesearchaeota archaeon]|nr:rhomboid family intramembrane serine protease [Candidatus Woesearchaeota archaeon]